MELIRIVLKFLLLSAIAIISLIFTLPPCLAFRFLTFIRRLMFSENVAGKVVLVTGAGSGIGEQISYEYARRGALLALVDIREDCLKPVIEKARHLGSPEVIGIGADVSKVQDSERLVSAAISHFGTMDHLVNNAGIARTGLFEKVESISELTPVMDVNFWGAVYGTHFAIPHLRKSKGRIIVIASVSGWYPFPGLSIYSASKAALIGFYEALRSETGGNISITIVTPGFINSKMTQNRSSLMKALFDDIIPMGSPEGCGKAVVRSACRGDRYLVEPSWYTLLYPLKVVCSEVIEFCNHKLFLRVVKSWENATTKKSD
ncbi:hypothetical protein SLA2020_100440 [Shorea laevis]